MRIPFTASLTIALAAAAAYGISITLHELAHAVAALLVGGTPHLISSTDMRGNFDGVAPLGFLAIGASGSAANIVLAIFGFVILQAARSAAMKTFGWIMFAINGFIPSLYLIVSPIAAFGDWQTVLSHLDAALPVRLGVAMAGIALTAFWYFASSALLAPLLLGDTETDRFANARQFALTVWLSGTGVALAAAIFSPLPKMWALPLAIGSTMGTTFLLMPLSRHAAKMAQPNGGATIGQIGAAWPLRLFSIVIILGFVFYIGPGVKF